ncbi:MAG: hypothetical protein WBV55_15305 [Candidatus Sulfotelmatobacter sp.]
MKSAKHGARGRREAAGGSSFHLEILRTATTEQCYDDIAEVHLFRVLLHL